MRAILVAAAVAILLVGCGGASGGGCKVKLSGAVTEDLLCLAASSPTPQGSGMTVAAYTTTKPRKTLSIACAATSQPPAPATYSGATCFGMWRQELADGGTDVWQAGALGGGSVTMTITGLGAPLSTVDGGYTILGNAQATLEAQSGGASGTIQVDATF